MKLHTSSIVGLLVRRSVLPAIAAGALLCCTPASAQFSNSPASPPFVGPAGGGPAVYQIDDGTAENSIGLTAGGNLIWFNQFSVTGGNNIILSISVAFGSPGGTGNALLNGLPFTAYLWSDPNNDGNPTDAVVLASAPGTVSGAGTNTFITVGISPTQVMGSSFFVGLLLNHPSGTFPAAMDQTPPVLSGRSWANTGGNPNSLAGSILIESVGPTFVGNWMVRANAVPEPSTYALLVGGVALVGFIARRRKKS